MVNMRPTLFKLQGQLTQSTAVSVVGQVHRGTPPGSCGFNIVETKNMSGAIERSSTQVRDYREPLEHSAFPRDLVSHQSSAKHYEVATIKMLNRPNRSPTSSLAFCRTTRLKVRPPAYTRKWDSEKIVRCTGPSPRRTLRCTGVWSSSTVDGGGNHLLGRSRIPLSRSVRLQLPHECRKSRDPTTFAGILQSDARRHTGSR